MVHIKEYGGSDQRYVLQRWWSYCYQQQSSWCACYPQHIQLKGSRVTELGMTSTGAHGNLLLSW